MNAELEMLCHRLLSALFNAVYQGLVLTALLWLGLRFVSRMNAATRHALSLATLLVVTALPVVHFLLPVNSGTRSLPKKELVGPNQTRPSGIPLEVHEEPPGAASEIPAAKVPENFGEALSEAHGTDGPQAYSSVSERLPQKNLPMPLIGSSVPGDLVQPFDEVASLESLKRVGQGDDSFSRGPAFLAQETDQTFRLPHFLPSMPWSWRLSLPGGIALGLIGIWIVLAAARLGNLIWQCGRLASLKRQGTTVSEPLHKMFDDLCAEMQVRRKAGLLTCSDLVAPMVVGFRRPAVLLPMQISQSAQEAQLEQILRHELAHVRRGDDWTNLLQQVIQAALFFHPAIWWLSRRLTIDREIACDDHVLAATRTPREYALFLTEFAGRMHGRDWAAAPAAWSNKSQLNERITMILDSKRNSSTRLARARVGILTTGAALIAVLGFYAGPRLALAQDQSNVSSAETAIAGENDRAIEASVSPAAEVADEVAKEPGIDSRPVTSHEPKRGTGLEPVSAIRKTDGLQTRPTLLSSPVVGVPQEPVAVSPPPAPPVLGPSGPRLKTVLGPQPSLPVLPSEVAPVPPRAPVKVTVPVLAQAPAPAAFPPQPALVPRSVLRASGKAAADDSIARRLERLERLVESLLARDKKAQQHSEGSKSLGSMKGPSAETMILPKDKQELKTRVDVDLDRIHEQAARQAERAMREVERATKELERAAAEAEWRVKAEEHQLRSDSKKHPLEMQRKALETQRRTLERQIQNIQKRIAQLEQEHEKLEADQEKPSKKPDQPADGPKPKGSPDDEPKRKW